tara:strand:- start:2002 stop:2949 length:948 start_codon:yes stop_codon:yes gene_type:complete
LKKNKKFAAIDIGSHNCRLLISEKKDNLVKTVFNSSMPTNLIKNLSYNNEFNEKNIKKTLEILSFFSKKIKSMNVFDYRCIATEACRSVVNPDFFIKKVKEKTDLNVEVITSSEEARLSMKSCRKYISKIKSFGIIFDIGGGSTELSCFMIKPNETITKSISYGVINYDEKCEIFSEEYVTNQLNHHFFNYFKELKNIRQEKFSAIGSCSTVTSLCCIFLNLPFYNPKKVEGFEMDLADVIRTINHIEGQSDNTLEKHPCIGSRYLLLKSGIKILKIILNKFPIEKLIVTQKGLRDALAEEIIFNYEKNKTKQKT